MMEPILDFKNAVNSVTTAKAYKLPRDCGDYNVDPLLEYTATGRYSVLKTAQQYEELPWSNKESI